jgi:hypothetical protein
MFRAGILLISGGNTLSSTTFRPKTSHRKRMACTNCCIYRVVPPDKEQWTCLKHLEVNFEINWKKIVHPVGSYCKDWEFRIFHALHTGKKTYLSAQIFSTVNLEKYLQPDHITRQEFLTPSNRNQCARQCIAGQAPKICYYTWTAEDYVTLGPYVYAPKYEFILQVSIDRVENME